MTSCFARIISADKIVDDKAYKSDIKTYKQINDYLLIKKIGKGSSSKVYKAVKTSNGKQYAVKAVKIDPKSDGLMCLEREIRNMRRLGDKCKNLIKLNEVYRCIQLDTMYLILEYAPFGTLQNYIDRSNSHDLNEDALATIFRNIAHGVKYLHENGLAHRDIKPANILLFDDQAKLADFGNGHSFQSSDCISGSPAFMAPEVFDDDSEEDIDPTKEDVWSIGITLYNAVFKRLPFVGETVFEIARLARETKLKIPDDEIPISKELKDLIKRALAPNPNERISMDDLLNHPFILHASETYDMSKLPSIFNDDDDKIENIDKKCITEIPVEIVTHDSFILPNRRSLSWPLF